MKRYNVTIERTFLVYADSREEAGRMALTYLQSLTAEPPASRPIKVTRVEVVEVPTAIEEQRGPIVDGAPPRETR